jgi:hypothetical protein
VGGRTYRWAIEQSEAWRGFQLRTVYQIRIEPVRLPSARISAYLVERTTCPSAPMLTVRAQTILATIREAHRHGWKPARGQHIVLYNLEHLALPIAVPSICETSDFVRE